MVTDAIRNEKKICLLTEALGLQLLSAYSCWLPPNSLGHHHLHKLFVVDLPITVNIRLSNHLIHLLISELLTKVGHDMAELRSADEAVAVAIEHLEGFDQLLLCVGVFHLARHEGQKLGKVDGAITICVDLVDHVLELSLCGVLPQRPHHCAQLLCGDCAVAIFVEERESLPLFSNLLL